MKSQGTILKRGSGGETETFAAVAKVTGISGPGLSMKTDETTALDDTAERVEGVLLSGGEVKLDLNFVPSDTTQGPTAGLLKDWKDMVIRNFQICFADTAQSVWEFAALVTNFEPNVKSGSKLSASVTLKLDGIPTFTTAQGA
jgi:hypothetical protein